MEKIAFLNRKLYFIFQGVGPEKWVLEAAEYTMKRFAFMYGFTYGKMITNQKEAKEWRETI